MSIVAEAKILFIYLFIYYFHNKDYTSITLYKDVARGPQKTTRLVRGGPLVTIILSNRTIEMRCAKGEWVVWYNVTKVLSIEGSPGLRMLQRIKCLNKQYVKLVELLLLQNTVNEANFAFVVG